MHVHRLSARIHGCPSRFGDRGGIARCSRVNPIAVQRGLKEYRMSHRKSFRGVTIARMCSGLRVVFRRRRPASVHDGANARKTGSSSVAHVLPK
jgi:hypothetical protein